MASVYAECVRRACQHSEQRQNFSGYVWYSDSVATAQNLRAASTSMLTTQPISKCLQPSRNVQEMAAVVSKRSVSTTTGHTPTISHENRTPNSIAKTALCQSKRNFFHDRSAPTHVEVASNQKTQKRGKDINKSD